MILLGSYPNRQLLQGLVDYLALNEVYCEVNALQPNVYEIWIPESKLPHALPIWQGFLKAPHNNKFRSASWQLNQPKTLIPGEVQSLNLVKRFFNLHPFILLITFVCTAIYGVQLFAPSHGIYTQLQFSPLVWYRFITPAFLHLDTVHLIFNLGWWLMLGNLVSRLYSVSMLTIIFFITALISHWAQYLFVGANFGGLSGVVYGLVGFLWLQSLHKPEISKSLPRSVIGFMLVWMAIGFTEVLFINMANWAHFFGLLSGCMCSYLYQKTQKAT